MVGTWTNVKIENGDASRTAEIEVNPHASYSIENSVNVPPRQKPFTAAITGLETAVMLPHSLNMFWCRRVDAIFGCVCVSGTSPIKQRVVVLLDSY